MRVRNSRVLYVCALALIISLPARSAHASFSNASLKGTYSILVNRWTANSTENQFAELGVLHFEGAGNVTISFTSMTGGIKGSGTESGTYTVNANSTGTMTFTGGSNPPTYSIVINSSAAGVAKGISLLRTDNNYPSDASESGTAVLQSTTAVTFSLASLKGSMSILVNQWQVSSSEDTIVGIGTFSGTGTVKGSSTARTNGVEENRTATGTYTVNSDGSGSITLNVSDGTTEVLAFVLNTVSSTSPAKGMQLLQTSGTGNQAVTGIGLKQ